MSAGTILGSYPLSNVDSVNPYSGRVGFSIPVRSIGGRGSVGHSITISPGRVWRIDRIDNCTSGDTNCSGRTVWENPDPTDVSSYEIGYGPGYVEGRNVTTWEYDQCTSYGGQIQKVNNRIIFHTPGGEVVLRDTKTNGKPLTPTWSCYDQFNSTSLTLRNREKTFVAADGSNIRFVSDVDIIVSVRRGPS